MAATLRHVTFSDAAETYRRGIAHAHNVVWAHGKATGGTRGKKFREVSLNRAIVLMAMASWQAVVEDLTLAAFAVLPGSGNPSRVNKVMNEVTSFSTPSAYKTRRLLRANLSGFDVLPHWTWKRHGGQGIGVLEVKPEAASYRLESWLRIRHAVAHGHADLFQGFVEPLEVDTLAGTKRPVTQSEQLTVVSKNFRRGGSATLALTDARECLTFVNDVAEHSGNALTDYCGVPRVQWRQTGGISGVW